MKKEILDLKQDQCILIENVKYRVLNRVKFVEKSSYWLEYKLRNLQDNEMYYLNVELSMKVILYKVLQQEKIKIAMNVEFQDQEYKLVEKGTGKVETYNGMTDVEIGEVVEYYEYMSENNLNRVLSIEKWKDEIEISYGEMIRLLQIRVLKEFEE